MWCRPWPDTLGATTSLLLAWDCGHCGSLALSQRRNRRRESPRGMPQGVGLAKIRALLKRCSVVASDGNRLSALRLRRHRERATSPRHRRAWIGTATPGFGDEHGRHANLDVGRALSGDDG